MNTHNDADIFRERQVERDGTRICFAETLADAKAKIDEIADAKE